jgi:peptide/nickel transport system permease protein
MTIVQNASPVLVDRPIDSERRSSWRRFTSNPVALAGGVLIAAIMVVVLLAPVLPLQSPDTTDLLHRSARPFSSGHILGTDQVGRDMLSRLIWGTRVSLAVGITAAFLASVIGSTIGLFAAYYGGIVDTLLMRGIDMLLAFPYLLLALAIVAALGPSLTNAMIAIIVVNTPFFARAVRGATVSVRQSDFIAAAHLAGLGNLRIIFGELLPNVLPVIVVSGSTAVGWMILETAGLSFLGLGAQPPLADLGGMLGQGRELIYVAPHIAAIPGMAILAITIGVNLIGDGIRDVLDPKLKSGGLARIRAATEVAPAAERKGRLSKSGVAADAMLAINALETQFRLGESVYRAVDRVSLAVKPGEAVGLVGESGSGKTVTALSILGLVATPPGRIAGGEVLFHGEDLAGAPLQRLQDIRGGRIAYVFQDPLTTLNPLMTVGDQIAESIRRHQGLSPRAAMRRAIALMAAVAIPDPERRARSYPHELSGGQRQRIGIAIAVANRPELIIADEPTTALDVTTQARVLELMNALRREYRSALILISHDFGVVAELCDTVHVMYAGRIVESGPVARLLEAPAHPYTARLLACVPKLGRSGDPIVPIPGLPPSTNDLPPGCAFAPRCALAEDQCRRGEIPVATVGENHTARCLHAGDPRLRASQ